MNVFISIFFSCFIEFRRLQEIDSLLTEKELDGIGLELRKNEIDEDLKHFDRVIDKKPTGGYRKDYRPRDDDEERKDANDTTKNWSILLSNGADVVACNICVVRKREQNIMLSKNPNASKDNDLPQLTCFLYHRMDMLRAHWNKFHNRNY